MIQKKRIESLDALRGIAAMIVVFHHIYVSYQIEFRVFCSNEVLNILRRISDFNFLAVLFFFVLSGFSIALSLGGRSKIDRRQYFKRRAQRIVPIYWIALLLSACVGFLVKEIDVNWADFFGNLLFFQSPEAGRHWVSPFAGNGPLWSLSFEVWFYVITPWFVQGVLQKRHSVYWMILASLLISVLAIGLNSVWFLPQALFQSYYPIWLMGFCFVIVLNRGIVKSSVVYLLFVCLIGMALLGMNFVVASSTLDALAQGTVMVAFLGAFTILMIHFKVHSFYRLPGQLRFLRYIGEGSYALYALHMPVLILAQNFDAALWKVALGATLFIPICHQLETRMVAYFRKNRTSAGRN